MFCPHCGKQIPDGSKFCPYCGANLEGERKYPVRSVKSYHKTIILVIIIVLFVIIIGAFSFVYLNNRLNSPSAIANKFINALQNSDYNLLGSLITIKGEKSNTYQIKAFCKWANDKGNIENIRSQLDSYLLYLKSGTNFPLPNSFVSITDNKSFFIFKSYSIDINPSDVIFSGINGTVITIENFESKTIGNESAVSFSLIPGEYNFSIKLPTVLGSLNGSGNVLVEPLKKCRVDVTSKFQNSAFYKIPSDIQPEFVSLNGNVVMINSGSSGTNSYLYVGPFPNGIYDVSVKIPSPWGSFEYTGVTENSIGWSTISFTGVSNTTKEKLNEIAEVIDNYNMNDTLLERRELNPISKALEGLEPGSPIYIEEEKRISKFANSSPLNDKYFQMILSSKLFSSSNEEIKVVCAENYVLSSPVFVYTVHYNNGVFSLYECSDFSGSISDYISSPDSVFIKHSW